MINSLDKNIKIFKDQSKTKKELIIDINSKKRKILPLESLSCKNKEVVVNKCEKCSKKLNIVYVYSCRCGNNYCSRHRFHDQHECTYDFKTVATEKLRINNPKIINRRIGD